MMSKQAGALPLLWVLLMLCCGVGCAPKSVPSNATDETPKAYRLLSKKEASKWVIIDEKEQFFDKVANLEMSIQLKQNLEEAPRGEVLETYKKMLQDDLADFSKEEKENVRKIFDEALALCKQIKPDLNLPEIYLIKTEGKYYGPGVYYTRDNSIVIPAPMLKLDDEKKNAAFLSTMLHEIFHVYSRYNKDKRDAMYKRIGFEKLEDINLSNFLKERVLYNPDGVDLRYAIDVTVNKTGKKIKAIPVIYSRHKTYRADLPAFFGYLTFQLFEIRDRGGMWTVMNKDVGHSVEDVTGFWEQVGRNTRYNIHPDEICADNFVIMALAKKMKGENIKKLSKDGQQLVKELEEIIKK